MNKMVWKNWAPQNINYLLSWSSKIFFERRIILKNVGRQIFATTNFASKLKSRRHISSCNVANEKATGNDQKWLGQSSLNIFEWMSDLAIHSWWTYIVSESIPNHKAMSSLTLLVSWKICN
jgi:hypothetical protein